MLLSNRPCKSVTWRKLVSACSSFLHAAYEQYQCRHCLHRFSSLSLVKGFRSFSSALGMVLGWFRDCIYMVNAPEFTWAPACKRVLSHHVDAILGTRMYAQKLLTRARQTQSKRKAKQSGAEQSKAEQSKREAKAKQTEQSEAKQKTSAKAKQSRGKHSEAKATAKQTRAEQSHAKQSNNKSKAKQSRAKR